MCSNTTTYVKGRHTFKAGISFEYSGQDDFDQINVNSIQGGTNNQNGQFEFRNNRTSGLTTGIGARRHGPRALPDLRRARRARVHRWRALATDIFVQDSWRPTSKLTVEGGVRYVIWPPWHSTTNNIANFDPRFYNAANAAVMSPVTGRLVSGPRYNGIVLPGRRVRERRQRPGRGVGSAGAGAVQR